MPTRPHTGRYNEFLLANAPWPLDEDTALIGHSAGTMAALGYLGVSGPDVRVGLCVLVASLKDNLGMDVLSGLFESPYDFKALRERSLRYVLFHSDNDPYCPLSHGEFVADQLGGELIVQPGQGHFNADSTPPYVRFPDVLQLLVS